MVQYPVYASVHAEQRRSFCCWFWNSGYLRRASKAIIIPVGCLGHIYCGTPSNLIAPYPCSFFFPRLYLGTSKVASLWIEVNLHYLPKCYKLDWIPPPIGKYILSWTWMPQTWISYPNVFRWFMLAIHQLLLCHPMSCVIRSLFGCVPYLICSCWSVLSFHQCLNDIWVEIRSFQDFLVGWCLESSLGVVHFGMLLRCCCWSVRHIDFNF